MKSNKKFMYRSIALISVVLMVAVLYFFGRPVVANNYAEKAIDIYLEHKAENNTQQFRIALDYLEAARKWGRDDTNLGILKGQLLVGLGLKAEAIAQYELVKEKDTSAIAAVDELLKEIK